MIIIRYINTPNHFLMIHTEKKCTLYPFSHTRKLTQTQQQQNHFNNHNDKKLYSEVYFSNLLNINCHIFSHSLTLCLSPPLSFLLSFPFANSVGSFSLYLFLAFSHFIHYLFISLHSFSVRQVGKRTPSYFKNHIDNETAK